MNTSRPGALPWRNDSIGYGFDPVNPADVSVDVEAIPHGYSSEFSVANKLARVCWTIAWAVFCRLSPRPFHGWRRFWLRLFGARLDKGSKVFPSARVWAPWNLEMHPHSMLGDYAECYNVDRVVIEEGAIVSQFAFLCTASHDITDPRHRLITAPIRIGRKSWVCAGAFVGMGITLGAGAVAGARAVVTKDVPEWTVVVGNPARVAKRRVLRRDIAKAVS